ncbi:MULTISPECIES: acyl-CoA dehydrogenase family protein [Pseudomonas]|jgi:alkylation response protein AidB-like acyl-CoA dehydrogenase|uniref:acyl-CoA dehydrogenase family protein n=1 Tax=Pseudomonas TaxID=286 RepID=UPI0006D43CA7|nr:MULTISPECIES: acyl-CoA dehydrogenase family protein [Pseudomonas]MBA6121575.1 acyl-CoA dehydrogenase [Pseudomonas juntendi]MBI6913375.1 acyl-CoA dehydrogenase [Pseudomonas juntendi]MCQ1992147.1 acyl-CoA dehydrogenase family protein [Pseudomonas sp. Eb3]MDG9890139.1 acyl-CoA dehydrogenase family protein [Pseudomonas juntendi]MDG9917880.1 acyl-CoA dehydrogenase family protein [Pseudomonas juntendi]
MAWKAPLLDMQFVLQHWLQADKAWQAMPPHADLDLDLAWQVLEQAARFTEQVLVPLNATGDRQGCRMEAGQVRTPHGFPAAYQAYVEAGWPALACTPQFGGQGLPLVLDAALQEMLFASNHAWAMYTGIAHGAYQCLQAHASEQLQARYLPGIVSGEILPTMCLTEPQAGSDLGLLRCRAEPSGDGRYAITGNKLFISGGDHDLTRQIVHLVLARLPGAPAGSRGLSLLLVPKWLEDGQRNAVQCEGLEHKLGIRGSATCALRFEAASGWLVGQAHGGLAAMFVMMNSARLHVGLQGLAHAEAAWQCAREYAMARRQMNAPGQPKGQADPIHLHPAIRRVLLELRVRSEGMRALGYWAAHWLDVAAAATDPGQRAKASTLAALLTPVIKAAFTEQGFTLASKALQVFGGYGYTCEFSIEQTLRDSRIAMIYEGTNEVQANDLLLRKVLGDGGAGMALLLGELRKEAGTGMATAVLQKVCAVLQGLLAEVMSKAAADPEYPYRAAGDFLQLCATALQAFAWARTERCLQALPVDAPLRLQKQESIGFFCNYLMLDFDRQVAAVAAAAAPLPSITAPF